MISNRLAVRPPRVAAWFVELFASPQEAEAVLGDLAEEFIASVARDGAQQSCPHGHSALCRASCRHVGSDAPIVLKELSGVRKRPMIIRMPTPARPQQRYDHRLRDLVQRAGDVTIATDLGVPRSTARGWLGGAPAVVVGLDVVDFTEPELRQEVLKLRRRIRKLTALLRLALALLRTSGFRLTGGASPGRTRQDADPARRGWGPRVSSIAIGPAVPPCVAESVPRLASAAERVCAGRSVLLSSHIAVSTDAS
jgi:hypothetical protein